MTKIRQSSVGGQSPATLARLKTNYLYLIGVYFYSIYMVTIPKLELIILFPLSNPHIIRNKVKKSF